MLTHRGEILRSVIDKYCAANATSITSVAQKAGYNQATIYRHFAKEDLSFHIIRKYGRAMRHDFSREFPEMKEEFDYLSEPEEKYETMNLSTCIEQRNMWQSRYYELLEKHNALLTEKLKEK